MKVGFFVTCLVDLMRPSVGFAAIDLLEQSGADVSVPSKQTCCGQPAFNNGDMAAARPIARQVIQAFASYDYVVVPSGSCAGMIRVHYPELFEHDFGWQQKARDLADRTYELTSFLVDIAGVEIHLAARSGTVTYHDSCSGLRELQVHDQPRKLLAGIDDLKLIEIDDGNVCCGFGGTFCVKYADISTRMVDDKVERINETGADVVLGGDLGCLLNIAGRLRRRGMNTRVFHVAEWLADNEPGAGIAEPSGEAP
ncbi:MAG: Fe-S oxidoreductase [marine bacterium B5-7]|nr:MAG: Fe-S oxidoreductase [marine bacterium B5-7]